MAKTPKEPDKAEEAAAPATDRAVRIILDEAKRIGGVQREIGFVLAEGRLCDGVEPKDLDRVVQAGLFRVRIGAGNGFGSLPPQAAFRRVPGSVAQHRERPAED